MQRSFAANAPSLFVSRGLVYFARDFAKDSNAPGALAAAGAATGIVSTASAAASATGAAAAGTNAASSSAAASSVSSGHSMGAGPPLFAGACARALEQFDQALQVLWDCVDIWSENASDYQAQANCRILEGKSFVSTQQIEILGRVSAIFLSVLFAQHCHDNCALEIVRPPIPTFTRSAYAHFCRFAPTSDRR